MQNLSGEIQTVYRWMPAPARMVCLPERMGTKNNVERKKNLAYGESILHQIDMSILSRLLDG